jgi:hypothetical protein
MMGVELDDGVGQIWSPIEAGGGGDEMGDAAACCWHVRMRVVEGYKYAACWFRALNCDLGNAYDTGGGQG